MSTFPLETIFPAAYISQGPCGLCAAAPLGPYVDRVVARNVSRVFVEGSVI